MTSQAKLSNDDAPCQTASGSTFNDLWVWRYYVKNFREEDRLSSRP